MSDAPERVWIRPNRFAKDNKWDVPLFGYIKSAPGGQEIEYVRADTVVTREEVVEILMKELGLG